MNCFTRLMTTTIGLALIAGCATNTRSGRPVAAPQVDAAQPPVKSVDPWAKSVPAAASTPLKTAEPSEAAQVAPTEEPNAAAPSAAGARTHTVAKGETLYGISKKYYGTSRDWPKIVDANPGLKPEKMPVGKAIVIP